MEHYSEMNITLIHAKVRKYVKKIGHTLQISFQRNAKSK